MGAVAKAVTSVVKGATKAVSSVVESVGDVVEDVADAVGDAAQWVNDSVLEPMLDNPVKTIATVAAIATGNPQLLPYINAADAAANGGDVGDIAKAFAVSKVAGEAGKFAGEAAGEAASSEAIGNIAEGAARGATSSTLKGGDPLAGALMGGATSGLAEGANFVRDLFKGEGTNIGVEGEVVQPLPEFAELGTGITPTTPGVGFNPLASSEPGLDVDTFSADAPAADYSLIAPEAASKTYSDQDLSYEIAPAKPVTESGQQDYQIDSSKVDLVPTPDVEYDWEGVGNYMLKQGQKALGQTLLEQLFGPMYGSGTQIRMMRVGGKRYATPSTETDVNSGADPTVNLQVIEPSKYDLKTFSNDAGNTMNIPFKDDEPQIPIPPGYKEVKMSKGGLAKRRSKKAVNVVQSAPNKPKTRKGLAVKT